MSTDIVQVQTTVGSEAAATRLGDLLVAERLAACVQQVGPVHSTYRWQGAVETASEWLLLVKSTEDALPRLLTRIRELHPYQTPEILALPVVAGDPDYLAWVRNSTGGEKGDAGSEE